MTLQASESSRRVPGARCQAVLISGEAVRQAMAAHHEFKVQMTAEKKHRWHAIKVTMTEAKGRVELSHKDYLRRQAGGRHHGQRQERQAVKGKLGHAAAISRPCAGRPDNGDAAKKHVSGRVRSAV